MARLRATLWLHDALVDDRTVDLHGGELCLDSLGIDLPGPRILVATRAGVLWVDGAPHPDGVASRWVHDARLELELLPPARAVRLNMPDVDIRLALVTAAAILLFGWLDAATGVVNREPDLAARAAAVLVTAPLRWAEVPCDDLGRYPCEAAQAEFAPDLSWRPPVRYQE
ncbi:MAG: hypothetical protein ACI8PZ_005796 [Myxococcota bacterium]